MLLGKIGAKRMIRVMDGAKRWMVSTLEPQLLRPPESEGERQEFSGVRPAEPELARRFASLPPLSSLYRLNLTSKLRWGSLSV